MLLFSFDWIFIASLINHISFQVYEILDNAVDEAQAGFATKINVVLHADNSISITDNGRGVWAVFFSCTKVELISWESVHVYVNIASGLPIIS